MSIAKLFVKVFGEDIFEKFAQDCENRSEDEPVLCTVPDAAPTPAPSVKAKTRPEDMTLSDLRRASYCRQMLLVKTWLQNTLDEIDERHRENLRQLRHDMQVRLGPDLIILDVDYTSTVRISTDRLSARSQGSFNTIKANACVYDGRWMYEVQLHSKGVMQLGWCSSKCVFNENSGVGDTKWSYGYDGSKQQIWHISTSKYGTRWQTGDIIGIVLDVANERIEFFRNGKSMGVAFNKLEKGPGISFFPAVSLGYNQSVQLNFGNMPFRFPIEGYLPLQAKPYAKLEKCRLLLNYLVNLSINVARHNFCRDPKRKLDKPNSTKKAVYVVFCTLLVEKIATFLFDPYIIEAELLPCLQRLSKERQDFERENSVVPGETESVLGVFLSILWNYLENDEMKYTIKKVVNALLSRYTQTNSNLNYQSHIDALALLDSICRHPLTRRTLLDVKFFKKHCLPLFLYIKPPEFAYMRELIPDTFAWTEGIGGPKARYMDTVERIRKATEPLYTLQKSFLVNLLTNNDGDETISSSRKIFLVKLRRYIMDISMEQRPFHSFFHMQSSLLYPIDAPIALAFISILVDATKTLFEKELSSTQQVEIPPKYFFDGSFEYQHFDRVGGVLSHLRKVHRPEIAQHLGSERAHELADEDRNIMRIGEIGSNPSIFVTTVNPNIIIRTQGVAPTFTQFFNPRYSPIVEATPGNIGVEFSLCELLDCCIMYYYCVGHKYVVKVASLRDEIAALNEVLRETKFYREDVESKLKALEQHASVCMNDNHCLIVSELKSKFGQRENVFAKRSIELARKQTWFRAVALGKQRRLILIWLLEKTLRTLNSSSQTGSLFSFVPEVYINILPILLDTVMDFSYHDLHIQFEAADVECAVNSSADFLSLHSADPRIILASCKDSLLQALGTLTCHKSGIRALERAPRKSQLALVRALLRPYENRAWGQSNWLLLRFWLGEGFAYRDSRQPSVWQGGNTPVQRGLCRSRAKNETHTGLLHHVAPAFPSKHFQRLIGTKLLEEEPFATAFLNSVLSQLNWAFSEFILLLQEIQNTAHRQENTVFEPKQLKICSMCFELTVSLMRCLEMIISVAPEIFQDASRANSDLLLTRVCQLISQVLSRVTVPPGCFQFVVDMCSADLNAVTHFPIITAALGILLALLKNEMETDRNPQKVTRMTRALLTDPSFQFANLEFALGEIHTPILQQTEIPRGNFDPSTRAHIDPLTNDVRVPMPSTSKKRIRADPPIIRFSLKDFPTHVTQQEIDNVHRLIEMLRSKQSLLSDITLPSEDSLCPICCAKPIAVVFSPCKHQSCSNCILQHLMNSKVCFYCKAFIKTIETADGTIIYQNNEQLPPSAMFEDI